MIKKKNLYLILIAVVSSLCLNGCGKSPTNENIETRNYTISIDGEKQYIDESEENFIGCTEMANNFMILIFPMKSFMNWYQKMTKEV